MNNEKYIIIYIFIFIKNFISEKIFKIPFYIKYIYYNHDESDFIGELFNSEIVTKLKIGSNLQEFEASIKFSSYHSYLLSNEIKLENVSEGFNKNNSKTYKEIKNLSFIFDDFSFGSISTDILLLNSQKIENFYFILTNNVKDENYFIHTPFTIGLRLHEDNIMQENYTNTFIYQIKKNNLSENLIFAFKFNKNNKLKGNFIIGENINLKNFYTIKAGIITINYQQVEFSINFNNVSYGNIKLNDSHDALFKLDIGVNIGTNELKSILLNDIMEISNKTNIFCYKKNSYSYFFYFFCYNNFNYTLLKPINFYYENLKITLTYKEYIIKKNNKIYINFLFSDRYYFSTYYFSRNFLEIFNIYFDFEKQLIYFPKKTIKEYFYKNNLFWAFFICSIIIIILIIIIIYFIKTIPRKIRANELEENYIYENKINQDKNINYNKLF